MNTLGESSMKCNIRRRFVYYTHNIYLLRLNFVLFFVFVAGLQGCQSLSTKTTVKTIDDKTIFIPY